jgi:hypothetical protein
MRSFCVALMLLQPLMTGCSSGEPVPTTDEAAVGSGSMVEQPTSPSSHSSAPGDAAEPETAAKPVATAKRDLARKNITFKTGAGERLYEFKFEDDGAKLVDPEEQEIARFNVQDRKVKIKLPDETVVAYIVAKDGEFQIRDESQKVELFEMKSQADGDWKLKDGEDRLLSVIKKRDYGFEIEDGSEKSLFKSKLKDGKRSLRNAAEDTVLYTKDEFPPISVVCLGLDKIDSLPIRAGLAFALLFFAE